VLAQESAVISASVCTRELIVGRESIHGHERREAGRPVDHENPLEGASEIPCECDLILDRSIAGSVIRTNKNHRPLIRGTGNGNQKSIHTGASRPLQYAVAMPMSRRLMMFSPDVKKPSNAICPCPIRARLPSAHFEKKFSVSRPFGYRYAKPF
jgi:hypothetical protein